MPKFGYFGSKSITFLILLAKFRMCSISNVLTSNLTLVFENFEPKSPFWSKSINCLILTKFFVCCFAGADFKSDICFQKFLAQIPKFKNFGPKSINLLILTKVCLFATSKVLISNLTFVLKNFQSKYTNL